MNLITKVLNPNDPYLRRAHRRYIKLPDEQREKIDKGYQRHVTACQKLGIKPDPTWLPECIGIITGGKI
mgnify:CR=1 FL=1